MMFSGQAIHTHAASYGGCCSVFMNLKYVEHAAEQALVVFTPGVKTQDWDRAEGRELML
jgi:hypothetical protein